MRESQQAADQVITYERGVELISESRVISQIDLGYAFLYRLANEALGEIIVLNSSIGDSVLCMVAGVV